MFASKSNGVGAGGRGRREKRAFNRNLGGAPTVRSLFASSSETVAVLEVLLKVRHVGFFFFFFSFC